MLNNIASILGVGGGVATDYESIATATGTGSSGVITFSSIAGTYSHLQLRMTGRSSNANTEIAITCNSDTGANYSRHFLYGDGSATGAGASTSASSMSIAYVAPSTGLASTNAVNVIDILDYANTNKYKTFRVLTGLDVNGSGGYVQLSSGAWRSTSAITSITLTLSGNYTTATSFALYGIK